MNDVKEMTMYVNVKCVMNALDVFVLSEQQLNVEDMGVEGKEPYEVYAIGQESELAAGLRKMQITPYFKTMKKLDEYCAKHANKIPDDASGFTIPDGLMDEWPIAKRIRKPRRSKILKEVVSEQTEMLHTLKRLYRCENHMQVCFVFDHISDELKSLIESESE